MLVIVVINKLIAFICVRRDWKSWGCGVWPDTASVPSIAITYMPPARLFAILVLYKVSRRPAMVIAIIVFVVVVISITWRIGYVVVRTQPRRTVLDIVIALEIYKSSPLVKVSKIADVRVITRCLQRRVIQMWCGVYQVFCHVSWPVLLS
jgi:hypothetical protein